MFFYPTVGNKPMPVRSNRPCKKCFKTTGNKSGLCDECEVLDKREKTVNDRKRGSSYARGYGKRWQIASRLFLQKHPLCVVCQKNRVLREATCVDHKIPHRGDMTLFWDEGNWQALCAKCHNVKTAKTDGGFGNNG